MPEAHLIAMLVDPKNHGGKGVAEQAQQAAHAKRVQLTVLSASTEEELVTAFASTSEHHVQVPLVGTDPFFANRREQITRLAAQHAIPACLPSLNM